MKTMYKLLCTFISIMLALMFSIVFVSADCKTGDTNTSTKPASESQKFVKADQKVSDNTYYITAKQANKLIKQNPNTVVLAVAYGKYPNFSKGHIPGAIQMSTNDVESEKNHWNILDADQLRQNFLKKGVTQDTPIIVYSDGILASSRVAFAAYWLGVKDVKIIDGGYQSWKEAGLPLQKETDKAKSVSDFGSNKLAHPEILIKTPNELLNEEKASNYVLVSTRSRKEYLGNISGYSYIKECGEVKDAVYGKISKSSSDVAYLTNPDGTLKEPRNELKYWEKQGITPNKNVIFYCGTGWRACVPFFLAKEEGYKNVKIYDGGSYDWNLSHKKDPEKYPVQKGEPGTSSYRIEKGNVAER